MIATPKIQSHDEDIKSLLARYLTNIQSHSLKDVGSLSLMKRHDTKFIIEFKRLQPLLEALKNDYTVLKVDHETIIQYENIYFDTSNFDFFQQHHDNKFSRIKIRSRKYQNDKKKYLEIKMKNNKRITHKERLAVDHADLTENSQSYDFLKHRVPTDTINDLSTKLSIKYQRVSLKSNKYNERVSIDIGLNATSANGKKQFQLFDYAVVELKQGKLNRDSLVYQTMRQYQCRPVSFSKYCISCALLFKENLRSNRFKPMIQKLTPYLKFNLGSFVNV